MARHARLPALGELRRDIAGLALSSWSAAEAIPSRFEHGFWPLRCSTSAGGRGGRELGRASRRTSGSGACPPAPEVRLPRCPPLHTPVADRLRHEGDGDARHWLAGRGASNRWRRPHLVKRKLRMAGSQARSLRGCLATTGRLTNLFSEPWPLAFSSIIGAPPLLRCHACRRRANYCTKATEPRSLMARQVTRKVRVLEWTHSTSARTPHTPLCWESPTARPLAPALLETAGLTDHHVPAVPISRPFPRAAFSQPWRTDYEMSLLCWIACLASAAPLLSARYALPSSRMFPSPH